MRVELDPSFTGEAGMLHIWNETSGAIQITPLGHLLNAKTSAWVTENSTLLELIEIGHAVVLSGYDAPAPTPKKSGKKSKTVEESSEPSATEDLPVVQDEPVLETPTETVVSEENNAN